MSAVVTPETVEGFRRGDDHAVQSVYAAYSRLVFTVAHRVLGDRSLAEEATQQTFVQAWRNSSTFEADRDFAPWVATIARRVAIDIHRREARRPKLALDDAPIDDPNLVTSPPSAEQLWEAWQIRDALDSLDEGERLIMRMQHFEGYTHTEIAAHLGIAVGTVKSRSFRARRALAAQLRHLREPDDDQ